MLTRNEGPHPEDCCYHLDGGCCCGLNGLDCMLWDGMEREDD